MNTKVEQALNTVLGNWKSMSGAEGDEAESTANTFEATFYQFIDAVRDWINGMEKRPQNMEELMELSLVQHILDRLPLPLHLNFETEAELILDDKIRIDEDKYD
ncbi:hypothetical protein [Paenibacillus mesophilus]|uniref:hypothetical protein n=1 Tax=Paenibacillus mesophilus TaxID=2582849 RepID=UPI001EE434E6|nr:hypothetical protein [Paenibacillus mesophilus]